MGEERKMSLIKKVDSLSELKDYNVFKHQLVKKSTKKIIEQENWKLETYTNYKNTFVYHYVDDRLVLVEVFDD